jgi:DNA-binding response OmpR family regulator
MSGLKVLRLMKEAGLAPIIWMLTGKEELEVITEAITLGAAGYLTKPFDVDKIRGILNSVLTPGAGKPSDRPWVVKKSANQGGQPGPEKP